METIAKLISLLFALGAVYQVYRIHRHAKQAHPALDYAAQSRAAADAWRWREPNAELGLTVLNDPVASRVVLPFQHTGVEIGTSVFGYGFVLLLGYLLISALWLPEVSAFILLMPVLLFGALAWALLNTDSHLTAIELRRDEVRVILRYGIVLQRQQVLRRHPQLQFAGAYQSALTMNIHQPAPDFCLVTKQRYGWIFSRQQRFYLLCNQSQGSWLVGGLNAWNGLRSL